MRAFGYCWAEVGDDGAETISTMPRSMIESFIKKRKLVQRGLYFEDRSQSITPFHQRDRGQEIDRLLRKGDLLVIPSQDCLFRTAMHAVLIFQKFRKQGISVQCLDLNMDIIFGPQADLIQSILQPLSRSEASLVSDRVRRQKQLGKAAGDYLGGKPPFGFKIDNSGKLVPDQKQRAAMKKIIALRAEGLSLRAIADEMRRKGVQISHMGVYASLKIFVNQRNKNSEFA